MAGVCRFNDLWPEMGKVQKTALSGIWAKVQKYQKTVLSGISAKIEFHIVTGNLCFFVVFPGSAENVICNFPSFPENLEKNIF